MGIGGGDQETPAEPGDGEMEFLEHVLASSFYQSGTRRAIIRDMSCRPWRELTQPWKRSSQELREFPLDNKYHFIYSQFGCMVENLIQIYGRERFVAYYQRLLKEGNRQNVFQSACGISFTDYLSDFKNRAREKGQQ